MDDGALRKGVIVAAIVALGNVGLYAVKAPEQYGLVLLALVLGAFLFVENIANAGDDT